MICPVCRAGYQDHIAVCATDGETLVESLPEESAGAFDELEAVLREGTASLSQPRSLENAQRDQEILHEAGVPCLLYANPASVDARGTPTLYHLAMLPRHVDAAAEVLGRRRREMLEAEGMPTTDAVVDLAATEMTCPACGFKFAPAEASGAECPDCGLFLGKDRPAE
jgi:hypothetical protein